MINNVLSDPELSNKYKPRAITRDANSAKAKALEQRQVEVVTGDASDRTSVERALAGANFVFIMSTPSWGPDELKG